LIYLFFSIRPHSFLQNVMRSSSDEDITMDAKQFVRLPQIVGRNSPASNSAAQSPAYNSPHAALQPLQGGTRTPTAQDVNRFAAAGSGGSRNSPSSGQQRPTSAIRLASLNHTPTFKQTSPKDDGDDSRWVAAAALQRSAVGNPASQAVECIVAARQACAIVELWG
jgi:hypothetical protein